MNQSYGKVQIVCLAFNNPTVIEQTIRRFYDLTDIEGLDFTFTLVDCAYPLPDKAKNSELLKTWTEYSGFRLLKLDRNYGQDGNYNKVFEQDWIKPGERLCFWDPDSNPKEKSWLKESLHAMQSDHRIGYCTLHRFHPEFNMREIQGPLRDFNGIPGRILNMSGGWPMATWSCDWIIKMRPLVATHSYYGGTEFNIFMALKRTGDYGIMLENQEDLMTSVGHDQAYVVWKFQVINHEKHPDFEEWLIEHKLIEVFNRGK